MFYPVDSLKRGGRFYLCWVADSWPLRFATITQKQLWSQDIRKICDDLLEVMTNESGRPVNRFSLRLSSQLMRGLVRLYQRKVSVFLGDLCMINANVIKNINKKWNVHVLDLGVTPRLQILPSLQPPTTEVPDEPENEQRIAELIQSSGNVVVNIQDITLKETAIPEVLPPNDGFGEENPELTLLFAERSVEVMLQNDASVAQLSTLEPRPLDVSLAPDNSRPSRDPQMEMISDHDLTMFAKSTGHDILPAELFEKDIPEIPDILIPEVPIPDIHVPEPQPDKQLEVPQDTVHLQRAQAKENAAKETATDDEAEIELEELEDGGPPAKRRRMRRLIIDKKIKISGDILHARIGNAHLELRCENSSDDIMDVRLPANVYFRRPCHTGSKILSNSNIALALTRLYQRNLAFPNPTFPEKEMEEAVAHQGLRSRTGSNLRPIEEEVPINPERQPIVTEIATELEVSKENNLLTEFQDIQQIDVSNMPTQKLYSPQSFKRKSDQQKPAKRQRSFGYITFREHQGSRGVPLITVSDIDKENVPEVPFDNMERSLMAAPDEPDNIDKNLLTMLEEAGLADVSATRVVEHTQQEIVKSIEKSTKKDGSDTSETPLGSLDRTKVSLGDSDRTTDSKRFIHDQWGTRGTMVKILNYKKLDQRPLTVRYLISKGPVLAGYTCIIAARCFTSILKLKQHGFICVSKDPETLEVTDIFLGPKFDKLQQ
ncbi:uncharacterized protein LOC131849466 [Achroia grisella]|uniref:uncharacterized protein LOC131849466 n=1 Tax=Achroia grisella TaxID=688607 RepID=UPI0027D2D612|nr:uncharacterized protein LOC131849466 [Achroia grisella]